MKGSTFAAAAALAGGAAAARLHHRHAAVHDLFRKDEGSVCVPECTTIYSTFYGEPTLQLAPPAAAPVTTSAAAPAPTSPAPVVAPTPSPVTVDEPGTYTIPGTTITLTTTTTIEGVATTHLPAGTHTFEGITTAVPVEGDYEYPATTVYGPGTYTRPEFVTTITVGHTVFYCPFTDAPTVAPAPAATSAPAEEAPAPTPAPTTAPAKEDAPAPTTTAAPEEEPAAIVSSIVEPIKSAVSSVVAPIKSSTPKAPTGGGIGGGNWFAMTYTPYTSEKVSSCKDRETIRSDIKAIADAGFLGVRVYSTECDTLPNVGAAVKEFGLKLIIGVFVKDDGCTYETKTIKDQVDAIVAWADWDNVGIIVVGNEARLSGKCNNEQLATLFQVVVAKTQAVGYTGGYTVAETTNVWQEEAFKNTFCDLVDVVGGNIHPYFNPNTPASSAGSFVKGQLELLDGLCPGKTSFNLECGWPKAGNCIGEACPGEVEQNLALASIIAEAGSRSVFFSYSDDMWKEPGDCGCEQSWGCGSLFESKIFSA